MKITVISASPKGEKSVTLQSLRYIQKQFSEHDFVIHHLGKLIKNPQIPLERIKHLVDQVRGSDAVIWVFPVFYLLTPYPVTRFLELIRQHELQDAFKGKYATAISTSMHFFDHTAHAYIHQECQDLAMRYVEGFSAGMRDLLSKRKREDLLHFARGFLAEAQDKSLVETRFAPTGPDSPEHSLPSSGTAAKTQDHKIVVVTDAQDQDTNLKNMVAVFEQASRAEVEILNLHQLNIKGACLSCYRCCQDGVCIYKDEMMKIYEEKIIPADGVVFGGRLRGRFLSSTWKLFLDRSFFLGHRYALDGKQLGWIISGPLRSNDNVRQVLQGLAEASKGSFTGIVTDEYEDADTVRALLTTFAHTMDKNIEGAYKRPETYLGVGGRLIFRDFTYVTRPLFAKDFQYYVKKQYFKYPKDNLKMRVGNFFLAQALRIPRVQDRFMQEAQDRLLEPYLRVIDEE